jgi:hypothetical protein
LESKTGDAGEQRDNEHHGNVITQDDTTQRQMLQSINTSKEIHQLTDGESLAVTEGSLPPLEGYDSSHNQHVDDDGNSVNSQAPSRWNRAREFKSSRPCRGYEATQTQQKSAVDEAPQEPSLQQVVELMYYKANRQDQMLIEGEERISVISQHLQAVMKENTSLKDQAVEYQVEVKRLFQKVSSLEQLRKRSEKLEAHLNTMAEDLRHLRASADKSTRDTEALRQVGKDILDEVMKASHDSKAIEESREHWEASRTVVGDEIETCHHKLGSRKLNSLQ